MSHRASMTSPVRSEFLPERYTEESRLSSLAENPETVSLSNKILQTDLSYGRANKRSQTERPPDPPEDVEGGGPEANPDEIGFLRMAMHTLMQQDRRGNHSRPLSGSYLESVRGGGHGLGEPKKYSDTVVDYRQMSPPGSPTYTETKASILRRRKNVVAGGDLGSTRRRFSSSLSELRDVGKESTVSLPVGTGRKFSRYRPAGLNRHHSTPYSVLD